MPETTCPFCGQKADEKDLKFCVLCGDSGCPSCMDQVMDPKHIGKPHNTHRVCITIAKVLQRALPNLLRRYR